MDNKEQPFGPETNSFIDNFSPLSNFHFPLEDCICQQKQAFTKSRQDFKCIKSLSITKYRDVPYSILVRNISDKLRKASDSTNQPKAADTYFHSYIFSKHSSLNSVLKLGEFAISIIHDFCSSKSH